MTLIATYRLQGQTTGHIASIAVGGGGGSDYVDPTVTITSATGINATAHATVVDGVITAITVDNPGSGYVLAAVVITDSVGTGATGTATVTAANTAITQAVIARHSDNTWRMTTANSVKVIYDGCDANANAILETILRGTGGIYSPDLFGNTNIA
jgi:hypothetical protein